MVSCNEDNDPLDQHETEWRRSTAGDTFAENRGILRQPRCLNKERAAADVSRFRSGRTRLVLEGGIFKVIQTANADGPLTAGMKSLLTIDVREHAYYLDYQNRRVDYANLVLDKLISWGFALQNAS